MIGANESSTLYLLPHIEAFRSRTPKIKVQVRRSQSSKIPAELIEGDLELGVASYDPGDDRLTTKVIYTDALAFIVSPKHRFARRRSVSIAELGNETFIAHNVVSPYREVVLREFQRHKVPLQHGRRDADARDDPPAGAERRRGRLPAADERAARRPAAAPCARSRSGSSTSSARCGSSTRRPAR